MKERPILFSGEMVRAILDGRKAQTRRVLKIQPNRQPSCWIHNGVETWATGLSYAGNITWQRCPYGQPGDRLWVKETHKRWTGCGSPPSSFVRDRCYTDHPEIIGLDRGCCIVTVPSIHMPRWASRINLKIVNVRVERVQDITPEDCRAEGYPVEQAHSDDQQVHDDAAIDWFSDLWDSINGNRGCGWGANPWVWVIEFRRVQP